MKKRTFADPLIFLDIDETILSFDRPMIDEYNKKYNKQESHEAFRLRENFSLESYFGLTEEEAQELVKNVFESDKFLEQPTLILSDYELGTINFYRSQVVFCSVFPEIYAGRRRESLDRFAPLFPILRCEPGHNKMDVIAEYVGETDKNLFLIDDNFLHLEKFAQIGTPVMVSHNYNKKYTSAIKLLGGMTVDPQNVIRMIDYIVNRNRV